MEQAFEDIDSTGRWQNLYNEIRTQANEHSCEVANRPLNRNLNRYRDVSPYDHSRVKLHNCENDYINANLVTMEEAQRVYILAQGPLRNTCGHFWLMIWEQCSKAVIMLNRVIEKGSEKCAQYWPTTEEQQMSFTDTGFVVRLLSEDDQSCCTVLELHNTKTGESREIHHFHYTTWPDFGVPESPASFLSFLFKVRESGALGPEHGPSVVHCSAGIGRSGTFSLVDTCLLLMDKRSDPSSVDIQRVLLDMRDYRMGLIQTADQLRFSYRAVLEGRKYILRDTQLAQQNNRSVTFKDDVMPDLPPPPPPPRPQLDNRPNGQPGPCLEPQAGQPGPCLEPQAGQPGPCLEPQAGQPGPCLEPQAGQPGPCLEPQAGQPGPCLEPQAGQPGPCLEPQAGQPGPCLEPQAGQPGPCLEPQAGKPGPCLEPQAGKPGPCLEPQAGKPGPCLEPQAGSGDGGVDTLCQNHHMAEDSGNVVRKRHREERIATTAQKLQQMKQRLSDSERQKESWLYWRPVLLNVGAGAALALGLLVCWVYC